MLDHQFLIHAGKGPIIIMNQLKSIYSSPFKDSHSHPFHSCFPINASNDDRAIYLPQFNSTKRLPTGSVT